MSLASCYCHLTCDAFGKRRWNVVEATVQAGQGYVGPVEIRFEGDVLVSQVWTAVDYLIA